MYNKAMLEFSDALEEYLRLVDVEYISFVRGMIIKIMAGVYDKGVPHSRAMEDIIEYLYTAFPHLQVYLGDMDVICRNEVEKFKQENT